MTEQNYNEELLRFIEEHPTSYHVIAGQKEILDRRGYEQLDECESWELVPGGRYYVIRNDSALIAFRMPKKDWHGYMIMASHADSPALKVKKNPEMKVEDAYRKLNVEGYGGLLMAQWLDRPLSLAGRLIIRTGSGMETRLLNINRDLLVIPGLAIHMNRGVNKGYAFNIQKDLLPLFGGKDGISFSELIAREACVLEEEILDYDLFLYNRQKGSVFGANQEYLLSPRLDDVQCAFASLQGFLNSEGDFGERNSGADTGKSMPVHVVFDNEEVGSSTRQGAASTFLADTLVRISEASGERQSTHLSRLSQSFLLSADNAHALHPNHAELCDPTNHPVLNGGVVLKHSANQKYTTDAVSASVVRLLARKAGIRLQEFHNRSDQPGGSTLGNISCNQVAVCSADVGIAQLAMHSICETCGAYDTKDLVKLAEGLFSSTMVKRGNRLMLY